MKKSNDLLNNYIDNELSVTELDDMNTLIQNDEKLRTQLKALKVVDETLKQMKEEPAPIYFTERLMSKINSAKAELKLKPSYYFRSMITIFVTVLIMTMAYIGVSVDWNLKSSEPFNYLVQIQSAASDGINFIQQIISNKYFMTVSSFAVLIVFIAAFYSFENYKHHKNRLDSISKT